MRRQPRPLVLLLGSFSIAPVVYAFWMFDVAKSAIDEIEAPAYLVIGAILAGGAAVVHGLQRVEDRLEQILEATGNG